MGERQAAASSQAQLQASPLLQPSSSLRARAGSLLLGAPQPSVQLFAPNADPERLAEIPALLFRLHCIRAITIGYLQSLLSSASRKRPGFDGPRSFKMQASARCGSAVRRSAPQRLLAASSLASSTVSGICDQRGAQQPAMAVKWYQEQRPAIKLVRSVVGHGPAVEAGMPRSCIADR